MLARQNNKAVRIEAKPTFGTDFRLWCFRNVELLGSREVQSVVVVVVAGVAIGIIEDSVAVAVTHFAVGVAQVPVGVAHVAGVATRVAVDIGIPRFIEDDREETRGLKFW